MNRIAVAACLLVAAPLSSARGDVTLHGLFQENMVLQREAAAPVWGTAGQGEEVTVEIAGQRHKTVADGGGNWRIALDPLEAGGPYKLVVSGKNKLEVEGVLAGEVWLCSGQSNMAFKVARSQDAEREIAAADHPQIRMFTVPRSSAAAPQRGIAGSWAVCSPDTAGGFSATAYFFGRRLHEELDVPVGLINSSVGGTPIEFWTSREAQVAMHEREEVAARGKTTGVTAPPAGAASLYNGMIHPLSPYAIRGAIWYQGERNSKQGDPFLYRYQLPAMIADWRELWDQGEFPFLFVQLPNYMQPQTRPVETNGWVIVREGMLAALKTPATGMAVTIDVGEAGDIHPKNKQPVGSRLAQWALAKTYGQSIVPSGPLYKSSRTAGQSIVIEFDHAGGGLAARGGKDLSGFAIAGEDGEFVAAEAEIVGQHVEARSDQIAEPAAVRYAWAANPDGNLINEEGLPASPFRTDDWPLDEKEAPAATAEKEAGWKPLFDGKSLEGWKATNFGGEGGVNVEEGAIILEMGTSLTGITYSGKPPKTGYEISLEAQRVAGVDFFCGLTFPVADSYCSFIVGGWAGSVVGLSSIDGKDASENDTTRYMGFKNGRWYKIRVRVEPKRIQAWIDDERVVDQSIEGKKISTRAEVDASQPLGISAWETKAALKNIRIRNLDQ